MDVVDGGHDRCSGGWSVSFSSMLLLSPRWKRFYLPGGLANIRASMIPFDTLTSSRHAKLSIYRTISHDFTVIPANRGKRHASRWRDESKSLKGARRSAGTSSLILIHATSRARRRLRLGKRTTIEGSARDVGRAVSIRRGRLMRRREARTSATFVCFVSSVTHHLANASTRITKHS